jgi:hypothetical protein
MHILSAPHTCVREPVLQAIAPLLCRTGGTPMEGATQGAMETFFRYYSHTDRCLELKFCTCTKVNGGEIVNHQ